MTEREALENTLMVYDHIVMTGCNYKTALKDLGIKVLICDYFIKEINCNKCPFDTKEWVCAIARWKFSKSKKNASMVADAALEALNDLYPEEDYA